MAALQGVPVERINARAAEFNIIRFVLAVLALPFMAIGVTARFVFVAAAWAWFAVVEGWNYAAKAPAPRRGG